MTAAATAKRRRKQAKLDKRYRGRVLKENHALGVKNVFLGNTKKKK
jgi:hypothetical protein